MAACIGLPVAAVLGTTHAPVIGGCGNAMAFAELADLAALAAATPDAAAFRTHLPATACVGLHLHVALPDGSRRARMFGPLVGVPEDPATGSANLGLAGLLLQSQGGDRLALEVGAGHRDGPPFPPFAARLAGCRGRHPGRQSAAGVVAVSEGRLSLASAPLAGD